MFCRLSAVTRPPHFFQRGDGGEQFPGVFHIIHQTHIIEGKMFSGNGADIPDDIRDGPFQIARPYGIHGAKIANPLAAARGLNRVGQHVSTAPLQVPARQRDILQNVVVQGVFTIDPLESAGAKIFNELRPGVFAAPDDDAVGMLDCLAGKHSHMDAAQYHGNAVLPKMFCERIRRTRTAGYHTDPDQISPLIHRNRIHAAVHNFYFHAGQRRHECGQGRQCQRRFAH